MKKIYLLMMCIVLISLASAEISFYVKQENPYNLTFVCEDTRQPLAICSNTTVCNITINDLYSSILVNNQPATNLNNGKFQYSLGSNQTNVLGEYTTFAGCSGGGINAGVEFIYKVTPNGEALTTAKIITYIVILGMLVFFLLISILMLVNSGMEERTYEVRLKKIWWFGLSYILIIPILFILWQITDQFLTSIIIIGRIFSGLFYAWTLGFIAVFVFSMFYVLRTIYIQKEVQRLINKGWPEEEARSRIKRKKR